MHDAAVDDGDGDGQPDAIAGTTKMVGGKLGALPYLLLRRQLWGVECKRWECVLGMSGGGSDGGCVGGFRPGALMVTDEARGLGWRCGDVEVSDGWVWRGVPADALLAG